MTATELRLPSTQPAARRKLPIVVGAVAVSVVLAVWIVAFSPLLGARTITVSGTHTLTASQVRTAAAIGHGAPLIRLDPAAVRKRVEALPDVASADVSVSYPSTVHIRISERVAVGYVAANGGYVLVDRSGAQYRRTTAPPSGLPQFAVPTGSAAAATGEAVAIVAAALDASVRSLLAQISADTPQAITLVLRDGRTIAWGSAEQSQQKAALLPTLLAQPGRQFDVSNPDLVVAR